MAQEKTRTALLVRCSAEEAQTIREAARRERRTISGFVLNAVMNRITASRRVEQAMATTQQKPGPVPNSRNRREQP